MPKENNDSVEGSLMYVQCCVCKKFMDSKPGPLGAISHGLCPECYALQIAELDATLMIGV
jgi:hypothetical protein